MINDRYAGEQQLTPILRLAAKSEAVRIVLDMKMSRDVVNEAGPMLAKLGAEGAKQAYKKYVEDAGGYELRLAAALDWWDSLVIKECRYRGMTEDTVARQAILRLRKEVPVINEILSRGTN